MKKIVIKMGRSIATSKRNKIDRYRFEQLAKQVKLLHQQGIAVVFIVSAAVCCGQKELGLKNQYNTTKSLVAGVGQTTVMAELYAIFSKHNLKIGQLLVTKSDLANQKMRENIKIVIDQALEQHITLIVNENDAVEIHSFDGNDYLAADLAKLTHADTLLLLTDVKGVLDENKNVIQSYTKDKKLAQINKINSKGEVGGMLGKIDAALRAANEGVDTWITSGKTQDLLTRIFLNNENIGTKISGGTL